MEQLRIPGPTPVPEEVLQIMSKQMINHRGEEFATLLSHATHNLKQLFQTRNDLYMLTGSGTGGLEAAIVNTLSPGDKVLSVSIGVFGDRFATIAEKFGADVIQLKVEWGKAADPEEVKQALKDNPDVKAVLITHNETSTGVTNDLEALSAVVKEQGKLLLVDAISSLGSLEVPVDKWNIDVAVSGSQKGWMVPPGLAFVSISAEAWKAHESATMPRFYWDFTAAEKYLANDQTPWTPAISVVYGLSVSLKMMLDEGLEAIAARHAKVAGMAREGVKSLGLCLFADEKYASNTVTAVCSEGGHNIKKLIRIMREEHEIVLGGGQQTLDGKIFRIGHLGWVSEKDIQNVLDALKVVVPQTV